MRVKSAVLRIVLSILYLEINQSIFTEIIFGSFVCRYFFLKLHENSQKFSFNTLVKTLHIIQDYKMKLTVNKYRRV